MSLVAEETTVRQEYMRLCQSATSTAGRMDLLNYIQLHKLRVPHMVLEHGGAVLAGGGWGMGDQKWDIQEQVALAALDLGEDGTALDCVSKLAARFPDSQRVKRLQGMVQEATGEYDEALATYASMLETNPANTLATKRIVAVHKARGELGMAIQKLTGLLQNFGTDLESWRELVDLHLIRGQTKEAVFCQEEVVLADPHNYQNHNRYAELLYTLGSVEDVRAARRHYALSLELKRNLRAAYGLCLSAHRVAIMSPLRGRGSKQARSTRNARDQVADDEEELNKRLFEKGAQIITQMSASSTEASLRAISGMVEDLRASLEAGPDGSTIRKQQQQQQQQASSSMETKAPESTDAADID